MQRCIGRGWRVIEGATIAIGTLLGMAWAFPAPMAGAGWPTGSVPQHKPAAPVFQVDPLWPKPLPNGWILGSVTGVAVDSQDHIWIVHRGAASLTARTENGLGTDPPTAEFCCRPAPPVLEFDPSGAIVSSWGGPGEGFDWTGWARPEDVVPAVAWLAAQAGARFTGRIVDVSDFASTRP